MLAYLSLFIAQALYTSSDVWKKIILGDIGFSFATFIRPTFIAAMIFGAIGFAFQMHALSKLELSRAIITMTVMAIVFSAAAGALVFKDQLSLLNYAGVALAVAAVVLVNWK